MPLPAAAAAAPLIAPWLGKALTAATVGGTALAAAPAISDIAGGGMSNRMFNEALAEGAVKGPDGKYAFRDDWFRNQFIDEDQLMPRWNEQQMEQVATDPRILAIEQVLGPGAVSSQFQSGTKATPGAINKLLSASMPEYTTKKEDQDRAKRKRLADEDYFSRSSVDARNRQATADAFLKQQYTDNQDWMKLQHETARGDRLQGRQDAIEQRIADREVSLMKLGMDERMFDKRLAADKNRAHKEKMATIIAGLSGLGAAFAI